MKTKPITIEPNSGTKYAGRKVKVKMLMTCPRVVEIVYVGDSGFFDTQGYYYSSDLILGEVIEPTRWRAELTQHYYVFNIRGESISCREEFLKTDDECFKFGNYFRAESQCEEAITRVKKVLLKYQEELMREEVK